MINKTKFEEICKTNNMFPVPDYNFITISREGEIKNIDSETGEITELTPIGFNKQGVPKYELKNYKNEIDIINLDRMVMNTFIGKCNSEIIHTNDYFDHNLKNLKYKIDKIEIYDKDTIFINGTMFKKIYIDNYESEYYISNDGSVFSSFRQSFKVKIFQHNFYLRIQLGYRKADNYYSKTCAVHRLVYETWNNKILSPDIQINHKNGRKDDNYYLNLEESTSLENYHHAMQNGLRYARWDEESVSEVCALLETNKYKPSQIANILGYTLEKDINSVKYLIEKIMRGEIWKHVAFRFDLSAYKNTSHEAAHPEEDVRLICELFIGGLSRKEICKRTGFSQSWINAVIRGEKRDDISSQYPINSTEIRRCTDKSLYPLFADDIMNGMSITNVSNKYNVNRQVVDLFVARKIYPEIGLNYDFEKMFPNKIYKIRRK